MRVRRFLIEILPNICRAREAFGVFMAVITERDASRRHRTLIAVKAKDRQVVKAWPGARDGAERHENRAGNDFSLGAKHRK